jgi:RNA polymerase sigma-70 factor (ECF subfamily)
MTTSPMPDPVTTEELFRAHAPFVARFLFRLGVRPDAIEDTVQEVFLVVLRQGGYRPGAASPTTYLGNIALHAATAYRRKEKARHTREGDALVDSIVWTGRDPVHVLETTEDLRRLQAALDRLEPDLRSTLILAELEGETCPAIAAAMGVPVGTVYWRLHRARKKFQHALHVVASANAPRGALALQAAGAGAPENSGRDRAGSMILMMSSGRDGEAADLLRLGRRQPPVRYSVQDGLAHHQQLAASGALAPAWAGGLGAAGAGATSAVAWFAGVALVVAVGGAVAWRVVETSTPAPARAATTQVALVPGAPSPPSRSPRATDDEGWRPVPVAAEPSPPPGPVAVEVPGKPSVSRGRTPELLHPGPDRSSTRQEVTEPPPQSDAMLELQEIATAERLLTSDPARALSVARAAAVRFPAGFVSEERRYVEITALAKLGRDAEARTLADSFLRDYPDGAFSRRVRDETRTAQDGR